MYGSSRDPEIQVVGKKELPCCTSNSWAENRWKAVTPCSAQHWHSTSQLAPDLWRGLWVSQEMARQWVQLFSFTTARLSRALPL